jgi:glycosyltransferase involved in cell wall biosynthesis
VNLCIDAGPSENGHRIRGIGTVARSLVKAASHLDLPDQGIELAYLRRHPFPDDELGRGAIRWAPRRWGAVLAGASAHVPHQLANWLQAVDALTQMPRDVRASGANVFLACDPHAVPLDAHFRTVGILYDVVPLVFPDVYLTARRLGLPTRLYEHRLGRLRRADHLLAISEATKRDAVRLAGFEADRISVVPLAVDRTIFRPTDPTAARQSVHRILGIDEPYFLYVGASDPRKNLTGVLAAMATFGSESKPLLLVAGAQAGSAPWRKQAADLGIANRVRWLDYVPAKDLPVLYAAAVAFVFPTLYEGFGLPILEAMSCGTPVVTSARSAVPEVAGDAALYVDPHSPAQIADAMRQIRGDTGLETDLRARGLARAAQFSWERSARMAIDACAGLA